MFLNEKFKREVQNLTTKLVSALTEFEKGSQNHDLCVQFSISNFCNHRFLTSDDHRIHRQIIGLVEKFLIHSQPEKSKCLEEMFKKFLENDLTVNSFSKSSVHYGLLDVLLHLSSKPLKISYTRTERIVQSSLKDDFDWAAHLLEGEDNPANFEWDESPYVSDEEVSVSQLENTEVDTLTPRNVFTPFAQNDLDTSIANTLICNYWNMTKIPIKPVLTCSLRNPLKIMQQSTSVEEINVMREVLWLLTGHEGLFAFHEQNGIYCVSKKVHLSHLSNAALQSMLSDYAKCGNIIKKLRSFIFSVELHVSSTYEAFAYSLSLYLNWLMCDVLALEKRIKLQEEKFLLQDLQVALTPHLEVIHQLSNIYDRSIGKDKKEDEAVNKSARLMHVLYEALLDLSNIFNGFDSNLIQLNPLDVLFNLWLDTVRPYLEIIDKWLCKGTLDDPKHEFILRKKNTIEDCRHPLFWYDAVVSVIKDPEMFFPWLSPVLNSIITGGKSMEILQTLSAIKSKDNQDRTFSNNNLVLQTIYDYFSDQLGAKHVKEQSIERTTDLNLNNINQNNESAILLRISFAKLLSPPSPLTTDNNRMDKHFNSPRPIPVLVTKALRTIVEVKSNTANHRLVNVLFEDFNLMQTLDKFHNFHLMAWGDVIHQFVSGVCYELLTSEQIVTDLVGINIMMQEAASIRCLDQAAFVHLKPRSKDEKKDDGLFAKKVSGGHQSIDVTDCIELEWKVDWPNSLVLSGKCIAVYNRIFSYLFQIKRAVYCVESLKFSKIYRKSTTYSMTQTLDLTDTDVKPMSVEEKRHRMSLLRTRILHLLQHWHGFIMTSVIQAEKHVLSFKLAEAKTLDDVLLAHNTFLSRICSLCLLDQENQASKLVHGTLKKIMNLAITFNVLWNSGINLVIDRSLIKHEATFHEFSEFLGRILKTIANRGAVPILDSLAYAILS